MTFSISLECFLSFLVSYIDPFHPLLIVLTYMCGLRAMFWLPPTGDRGLSLAYIMSLFLQIDGKRNPKVQSLFLQDFPIHKAAFVPDGSGVVAAGRRNFFFVYDLEAGRVERVNCLIGRDEKSLECFEVSPDSKVVAFLGNEGYILLTSLRTRQCIGTLKMNGKTLFPIHNTKSINQSRRVFTSLLCCGPSTTISNRVRHDNLNQSLCKTLSTVC